MDIMNTKDIIPELTQYPHYAKMYLESAPAIGITKDKKLIVVCYIESEFDEGWYDVNEHKKVDIEYWTIYLSDISEWNK